MDIKVYESKSGEVYVQLAKMSQTYKLLRSFIKSSIATSPDASIKMIVTMLDKAFDSPELSDNLFTGARNNNSASDGGFSQNMLANLNTKLDLLFKSVGALQNAKAPTTVKAELDQNMWDGLVHRIEDVLHSVLDAKLATISKSGFAATPAIAEDSALFGKLMSELADIKKIATNNVQTSAMHSITPVTQTTVAVDAVLPLTSQATSSQVAATVKEPVELNIPAPNQAVACDDRMRYPATSKKTRPSCFGNFLAGKTLQETPCLSCAWINDCQIEPDSKALSEDATRPDCFGSHRHDLDCGVCPHDQECLGASF